MPMLAHLDTTIAFAIVMLLLSLLITVAVQFVLTVLGLRGANLLWGVRRLLRQVDPSLGVHTQEIANSLLRHPTITHIWRFRAVALRKEELVRLLTDLSKRDPATTDDPRHRQILRKIVFVAPLRRWLAERFPHPAKALSPEAKKALQELLQVQAPQAGDAEIARVQAVASALGNLMPSQSEAVRGAVDRMLNETNRLGAEVNAWFDSVMDRTSERFKLHSRLITALLAFLMVIALQIDSMDIFRQLSNKEAREAVLQLYEPTLKLYEKVTGLEEQRLNLATSAVDELRKETAHQALFANVEATPPGLDSESDGERWLEKALGKVPPELLTAYSAAYRKKAEALMADSKGTAGETRQLLDQTGLRLIPVKDERKSYRAVNWVGILASGLFLSLGAPFWFNTLRKLSDLRPIVARRVEGEALKGAQKKEG